MHILIAVGVIVLLIVSLVYILAGKSGVYADRIEINVFKLMSIKISNKVKRSGRPSNHPERKDA